MCTRISNVENWKVGYIKDIRNDASTFSLRENRFGAG